MSQTTKRAGYYSGISNPTNPKLENEPQAPAATAAALTAEIADRTAALTAEIADRTAADLAAQVCASSGGYLQSDGATTNRAAGIYGPFDAVNNPRGWLPGVSIFMLHIRMLVPVSVSGAVWIWAGSGSSTTANGANGNTQVYLNSTSLVVGQAPDGSTAGGISYTISGFIAAYGGKWVDVTVLFTGGGVVDPVVKINGATAPGTASGSGSTWLSAGGNTTYHLVGYNWPSGPAPIVTPILGQTSAADDAFYMATGKWPAWVVAGGSPIALITSASRNSDFSAGATDWANTTVISNQVQWVPPGVGYGMVLNPSFIAGGNGINNVRLQLRFNVVSNTGVAANILLRRNSDIYFTISLPAFPGSYTTTVDTGSGGGSYTLIFLCQNGGGTVIMDNIYCEQIGALSLPSVQPINVIDDVSGIGGNQGRLVGATPITTKKDWRILGRINGASATLQQILGGPLFSVPLNQAMEFVDVECDGSVTLSLGDGTTATRYTASTALTAGRTRIALTTPFAADAAKTGLWVNVTVAGGTYAQFSILGHLLK